MERLTYFIERGKGEYEPFYEYCFPAIGADEIYARQLCTYFIMKGRQYRLISNEMAGDEEILVLEDMGENKVLEDERFYRGKGIHLEFRYGVEEEHYRLLLALRCETHFEVIRYLLKDVVDIPGLGQYFMTSTEIDEDRGCYCIYVKSVDSD